MAWGSNNQVFLGEDLMHTRDYSDHTSQTIDDEIERILREQEVRAIEVMTLHRRGLESLTRALLEHETIDGDTAAQLIDEANGEPVWPKGPRPSAPWAASVPRPAPTDRARMPRRRRRPSTRHPSHRRPSGNRRPYPPSSTGTTVTPTGVLGNAVVTSSVGADALTSSVVALKVLTPPKSDNISCVE